MRPFVAGHIESRWNIPVIPVPMVADFVISRYAEAGGRNSTSCKEHPGPIVLRTDGFYPCHDSKLVGIKIERNRCSKAAGTVNAERHAGQRVGCASVAH